MKKKKLFICLLTAIACLTTACTGSTQTSAESTDAVETIEQETTEEVTVERPRKCDEFYELWDLFDRSFSTENYYLSVSDSSTGVSDCIQRSGDVLCMNLYSAPEMSLYSKKNGEDYAWFISFVGVINGDAVIAQQKCDAVSEGKGTEYMPENYLKKYQMFMQRLDEEDAESIEVKKEDSGYMVYFNGDLMFWGAAEDGYLVKGDFFADPSNLTINKENPTDKIGISFELKDADFRFDDTEYEEVDSKTFLNSVKDGENYLKEMYQ